MHSYGVRTPVAPEINLMLSHSLVSKENHVIRIYKCTLHLQ